MIVQGSPSYRKEDLFHNPKGSSPRAGRNPFAVSVKGIGDLAGIKSYPRAGIILECPLEQAVGQWGETQGSEGTLWRAL